MIATENFEQFEISDAKQLRTWLESHHAREESIWLITFKKSIPEKYVDRWSVLDELLCFGWIDGIRRKKDEHRTMQLISPRRTQHWAKSYKDRIAILSDQERMHPAGLRAVNHAKETGLWTFMDDVDQLIVPKDLGEALEQVPEARAFFSQINNSSKRFVLRWLKLAKTEATRSKRISKLVELSARGEKLPGS